MKKIQLIKIVLTFVLMSLCKNSFAQFTNPSATENSAVVNIGALNTGNDILDLGGNTYRVSVWDDPTNGSPGFEYRVIYSGMPYRAVLSFSVGDIIDPDVCLVDDGNGNVYAVAVYFSGILYYDIFTWTGSPSFAFALTGGSSGSINGTTFGSAVNIDGNENGDIFVVWDDGGNNDIEWITATTSGAVPSFNTTVKVLASSTGFISPDVCLYYNTPTNRVNITYIDNNGVLKAGHNTFASLSSTGTSLTNIISSSPTATYTLSEPRIACPGSNNASGYTTDFTVVAKEFNGSSAWRIRGHTVYAGSVGSVIVYNDGSGNSPADLRPYDNSHPVVAYDSRSSYKVWIGWTFNDTQPLSGTVATFPIVLKCNIDGTIPGSSTYWKVPTSLNSNDRFNFLSLAGRHSSTTASSEKLFLTYHDITGSDIYTKQVAPASAISLRTTSQHNEGLNKFLQKTKCEKSDFVLSISDLHGRKMFWSKGNISEIVHVLNNFAENIPPSLFIISLTSADNNLLYTDKIFLGD